MPVKTILILGFILFGSNLILKAQEKAPAFLWLDVKSLLGSTPTVNNLVFVPGIEVQARRSFFRKKAMGLSAGLGYKYFRGINGVPFFGSFHLFPKGKREDVQSWFSGSLGYTYAWNSVRVQTRDPLRGGFVAQLEWGKKVKIGPKAFGSFSIGYEAQQIVQKFTYPNQETRNESLVYHFLCLGLGIGKQ